MKKIIFKNAWKLAKEMKMKFSDALKLAWKSFKNNAEVILNKSWNGINILAFKIGNCTSSTIEQAIIMNKEYKKIINSGAAAYYNGSTYNAD